jgi:methyl-accepting chemotaxis protein
MDSKNMAGGITPNIKKFPASLLKFDAYIKVVDSIDEAIKVMKKKRLAYGEPSVVSYKVQDPKAPSGFSVQLLFGIGTMDPDEPYFFGIYTDSDGNVTNISELMPKIDEIISEFYGKELTYLRYSIKETPTLTTSYKAGYITLGEAAIKRVLNTVTEGSKDLVTSDGIFQFIKNLNDNLTETLNDIINHIGKIESDVSTNTITIGKVKKQVTKLDVSVTNLTNIISALDASVNNLNITIGGLSNDVSVLTKDVSALDASVKETRITIGTIQKDVSILKEKVTVIDSLDSSLQQLYITVGGVQEDVSTLKADSKKYIKNVVSDSSSIKIRKTNQVVNVDLDLSGIFVHNVHEGEDGTMRLYWTGYDVSI